MKALPYLAIGLGVFAAAVVGLAVVVGIVSVGLLWIANDAMNREQQRQQRQQIWDDRR